MCEPVSLTMMALSVAQAGAGIAGQRSAAKTQFRSNATQREVQNDQINDQASVKAGERVKQARAEQARLRVAGGEAGVTGNSFEAGLMDSVMQADMDLGIIGKDAANMDTASEARFLSANASVRNPSLAENGLQIAGAAAKGYSLGQSLTIPTSEVAATVSDSMDSGTALADAINSPTGVGYA